MTPSHPELHPIFETLGYAGGYAVYSRMRRQQGNFLNDEHRWRTIAATAIGALLGSRIPFDTYNMFYRDNLEQTCLEPLRERTLASV